MLNFLFPKIVVTVVGKEPSQNWCGVSDYCVKNDQGERAILEYSNAWAEVGDKVTIRNFRLFWA